MYFNKSILLEIACRPSHDFNKEGVLVFVEKQDGFFKKSEIFIERWCRLRGNMLFYFKSNDHCSEPLGVIVLENYHISEEESSNLPHSFTLVHGNTSKILAALTPKEKNLWINVLQRASFSHLKGQIDTLLQHIKLNTQSKLVTLSKYRQCTGTTIDLCKPPFVEMSVACDNLRCNGDGSTPNPRVCVFVMKPPHNTWIFYAQTEVMERTSNPTFLSTLTFRTCDGIDGESRLCFIVCDVRERVSDTAIHLGKTMITVQDLIEAGRTRLFLLSPEKHTVGFISLNSWFTEKESFRSKGVHVTPEHQAPASSPAPLMHRRTQSLPPKLSFLAKYPSQGSVKLLYENPVVSTFRFHSGLGGDISAMEIMAEPILSFKFPQQLLRLWINEEHLSQEEIICLGDLKEEWSQHQVTLLTQHSTLINMYSVALGTLEASSQSVTFFKKSTEKEDIALEFAPLNLHLQRLFAQNDSLRRSNFYDVMTVGAFCANSLSFKKGGLLNMLQTQQQSSRSSNSFVEGKSTRSEEIVDSVRRFRKEIFILLRLVVMTVRNKDIDHMLRIIDQLESKIESLLQIIDPSLIIEAFGFVDQNRKPQSSLTVASRVTKGRENSTIQEREPSETEKSNEEITKINSYRSNLEDNEINSNCCYKATDEPEPWDLIQLNIRASLICLSSKVRNYCQRLEEAQEEYKRAKEYRSVENRDSTSSDHQTNNASDSKDGSPEEDSGISMLDKNVHPGNSDLKSSSQTKPLYKEIDSKMNVTARTKDKEDTDEGVVEGSSRSKMTESIDWIAEIRPSIKKLRHAIDGLMRIVRLTNSVFRLLDSPEKGELNYSIKYRKDICFSQALTSVVTALLTKIWCRKSDAHFASILSKIGPLVEFEVLLSYYRADGGRLADMIVAVEDLRSVEFVMVPEGVFSPTRPYRSKDASGYQRKIPCPRVAGTRRSLRVVLPVPEQMLSLLPHCSNGRTSDPPSFRITPVIFNIGINEEATLAAKLNCDRGQFRNNHENFNRLREYYEAYKIHFMDNKSKNVSSPTLDRKRTLLSSLVNQLHDEIFQQKSKNVAILQLASKICRCMEGLRFTSCKSAKDRTAMSATLEEVNILKEEFDLAETEFKAALDCVRMEGTRRTNCEKNTGQNRYAFSSVQLALFPSQYKPPTGSFGASIT